MTNKVLIFDTTLRDGEQSPGFSMNITEKLRMAKQLAKLKVDIIEAGFPISSDGDFESVREIAQKVRGPVICGLARTNDADIERAAEALKGAPRRRIHTFIATSEIHMKYKLKKSEREVLESAIRAVKLARKHTDDVEFSAEDATRSDPDFLCEIFSAVIAAGATTINIPDTVGYTVPEEYFSLVKKLQKGVKGIGKVVISVHCHNDQGLGVANSLTAVSLGARQVECTINGIGERAGNAAMEEIVMTLTNRKDIYGLDTNIDTTQIFPTSRLLTQITGIGVQPNKAVVGRNAFAHEAGIHQDGVLKKPLTYEIMTPQSIGLSSNSLVLGKHSGRHALKVRLAELGYEMTEEQFARAFKEFKELADKKKEVFDEDIEALLHDRVFDIGETYALVSLHVSSGTDSTPTAAVELEIGGKRVERQSTGDGQIDAAFKAIAELTGTKSELTEFQTKAVTGGTDAQGDVIVKIKDEGFEVTGRGTHTDVVLASAKAYVHALNKLEYHKKRVQQRRELLKGV
ncbi:MAG: 2-isopropylmalate synthase [Nitrospirae bacterium]|nr:2-isopropylmalate synthase [Nitrospirota bacterium]